MHHFLLQRQRRWDFGAHLVSLRMILEGRVDAAAVDSHVLGIEKESGASAVGRLRTVATIGPAPVPPVVAARHLSHGLKSKLRQAFIGLHRDPGFGRRLAAGQIDRFVDVADAHYNPLMIALD